jgi:DSF synthase
MLKHSPHLRNADRLLPTPTDAPSPACPPRPSPLFGFEQLETRWDAGAKTLWTAMAARNRPSFNPALLGEFGAWQDAIVDAHHSGEIDIRYLVLGSKHPGVFSLGGDLDLFANKIRARDRDALLSYGRACVRVLHRNLLGLDLPLVTIALVEGDALGGGFEALLSFNVVIAERGAKFGLPETLFGLFPGMGAHCFLSRRLGTAQAERLILSGKTYSAEEMYELGLVHVLVSPGQGRAAAEDYIARQSRRQGGHRAIYAASRIVSPLALAELEEVVESWANAALELTETDLKLMQRLVSAQDRLMKPA